MKNNRWRTQLRAQSLKEVPLKIQIKSTGLAFKVDRMYHLSNSQNIQITTFDGKRPTHTQIYETIVFGSRSLMSIDYLLHQHQKKTSEKQVLSSLKIIDNSRLDLRIFQMFINIQESLNKDEELTQPQKLFLKNFFKKS